MVSTPQSLNHRFAATRAADLELYPAQWKFLDKILVDLPSI